MGEAGPAIVVSFVPAGVTALFSVDELLHLTFGATLPDSLSAPPGAGGTLNKIAALILFDDGHLPVPTGPGIGIEPLPDALCRFTRERRELLSR